MLVSPYVPAISPHNWVDVRRYPVVAIVFPVDPKTADVSLLALALRRFANELSEPIAIITDLTNLQVSDPDARAIYTEFVKDMRTVSGKWITATAVIIKNPIQRAMLNLHEMMVGKTPYPVRSFPTSDEALPWLTARLDSNR